MRAGPLRDRIEIQAPTSTRDAGGALVVTYATEATRWGRVEPLSSRERLIAAQSQTRTTLRIYLRFYDGLTTRHRLKKGSRTFGIVGVTQPDDRKRETVCDVVEIV